MSDFNNPWDKNRKNKNNDGDDFEELLRKGREKIINLFDKKSGGDSDNFNISPQFPVIRAIGIVSIIALLGWLSTGFYTIQPDEEGVVLRLGKYSRTSMPGLNYKLPNPFETVTKVSVTRINRETIGFKVGVGAIKSGGLFSRQLVSDEQNPNFESISQESQMLTGDENIIDINFDVQWRVHNAKDHLFNLRDLPSENTVKSCAESAMREVIGVRKISEALAEERLDIEQKAKQVLQDMLDNYKMGVEVVRLQMLRVQPPPEVIDAYRDVQSAKADKEKLINESYAYRNSIIPQARGEAQKLIQEAESYKRQVIDRSEGEASRFNSILDQYQTAKDVTRKRMYYETMEQILGDMDKIIMDSKSSGAAVPYLPLQDLIKSKRNEAQSQSTEVK